MQRLKGMSIQWPAVFGVGMAADMDEQVKMDISMGIGPEVVKWVVCQAVRSSEQTQTGVKTPEELERTSDPVWPVLTRDTIFTMAEMPMFKFMMSNLKVCVERGGTMRMNFVAPSAFPHGDFMLPLLTKYF